MRLTARQLPPMVPGAQIQDAPMVRETMARKTRYATGYDAAYAEIHAALDEIDHPADCGGCLPCEVIRVAVEWAMRALSRRLSLDESYTLSEILTEMEKIATACRSRER